jgi:hypothetical protein
LAAGFFGAGTHRAPSFRDAPADTALDVAPVGALDRWIAPTEA